MKRNRILSVFAATAMLSSALPQSALFALAADKAPDLGIISPPQSLSVYDPAFLNHDENSDMRLNFTNSPDFLEFKDKWGSAFLEEDSPYQNRTVNLQVDFKLDDGDWHYNKAWDTNPYCDYDNFYDGFDTDYDFTNSLYDSKRTFEGTRVAEYLAEKSDIIEKDVASAFKKYTNGEYDFYIFDTDNHQLSFRARYYVEMDVRESDIAQPYYIYSDWSDPCVYGKGKGLETSVYPAGDGKTKLPAPKLTQATVVEEHGYADAPTVQLTFQPDTDYTTLVYENYDPHRMSQEMIIEMSPNGKDWYSRVDYSDYEYHNLEDFYDYWKKIEGNEGAFSWETATVQFRAKYIMNVWGDDAADIHVDYYLESDFCEPVSVEIPGMDAYEVKITHEGNGWNGGGTATKHLVEDAEIGWISVAPKEGCYVESVTIDGEKVYVRGDEKTYNILIWEWKSGTEEFDPDTLYDFLLRDDTNIASKDMEIVITYAGDATKEYLVNFIQHGPFSSETDATGISMSQTNGWEGTNNLKFYDGTETVLTIATIERCDVKQVFVDTVDVTDKLVFDEETLSYTYDFGKVTKDSSVVIFYERVGASWDLTWTGEGNIEVDSTRRQDVLGLVAGDKVNFSITPKQILTDAEGNPLEDTWTKLLSLTISEKKTPEEEPVVIKTYSESENATEFAAIVKNQQFSFVAPEDINIEAKYIITAAFSKSTDPIIKTYDITIIRNAGTADEEKEVVSVEEEYLYNVDLTPETGYQLDTVTVDGKIIENISGSSYVFTKVSAAHTISITYKKVETTKKFKVSVSISQPEKAENIVTPIGDSTVEEGKPFILTVKTAENCKLSSVIVNGKAIEAKPNDQGEISLTITADTVIEVKLETIMLNIEYVDWNNKSLYKATIPYGGTCDYEGETTPNSLNGWNDKKQYVRFNGWSVDSDTQFKKDTKIIAKQQILAFTIVPPSRLTYETKSGRIDTTDFELQVAKTDVTFSEVIDTVDGKTVSTLKPTSKTENLKYKMGQSCFIQPETLDEAFKTADTCAIKVYYSIVEMPDLEIGSFTIQYENGYKLGDVDRDGVISEKDAIWTLKEYSAVDLMGNDSILDDQQKSLADINGDKLIDTNDAVLILRYYTAYYVMENTDITWEDLMKH